MSLRSFAPVVLWLAAAPASAVSAVDVFAGLSATCALLANGGVQCWGATTFGEPGTNGVSSVPIPITGLPAGIQEVALPGLRTCARTAGGAVYCWGNDWQPGFPQLEPGLETGIVAISGQCALTAQGGVFCRSYDPDVPPAFVAGFESGAVAISYNGWHHGCGLTPGGGVRCWGSNEFGQLGNGETSYYEEAAAPVLGLSSGVLAVATGGFHTCALRADGEVWCWGSNQSQQLGDENGYYSSVPLQVAGLPAGVAEIRAGRDFNCARTASGGVWCWGSGQYGELGDGRHGVVSAAPVPVQGLGAGATALAAGDHHACAIIAGAIRCWGTNWLGPLGVGARLVSTEPVPVVGLPPGVLSLQGYCAITSAREVWCWDGQPAPVPSDLPFPVIAFTRDAALTPDGVLMRPVYDYPWEWEYALSGVTAIDSGSRHGCALKTTGSLWCWGNNGLGQLGIDPSPMVEYRYPTQVSSLANMVDAIALGDDFSCALTRSGAVMCWGTEFGGRLGNGSTSGHHYLPGPVTGLASGVTAISAGDRHTCALTSAGGVLCWGENDNGQLGDGSQGIPRAQPVPVSGLSSGVAAIRAGPSHTCALMQDGSMRCWGSNTYGQLGDGTYTNRLLPVVVAGISGGVSRMHLLDGNTCVVTTSGTVRCWGDNRNGQLGDGSVLESSVPLPVVGLQAAPQVPGFPTPGAWLLTAILAGIGIRRLRVVGPLP